MKPKDRTAMLAMLALLTQVVRGKLRRPFETAALVLLYVLTAATGALLMNILRTIPSPGPGWSSPCSACCSCPWAAGRER